MQFAKLACALALLSSTAVAQIQTSTTFDTAYDGAQSSTNIVACSNLTPRFPTLGSFPTFPYIGGAFAVTGFGSAACGSCWQITDTTTGVTINATAIDVAGDGFNLSLEAMNTLTDGNAIAIGRAPVTAVEVDPSHCGI